MARPNLFTHRKFTKLSRLLGAEYKAVGVLEIVWHHAYQDGNANVGSREDVEFLIRWDGEPGACSDALVESGFLDEVDGELWVHDLWDHAPDYVRKRRSREEARRPKSAEKKQRPDSDQTVTGQRQPNGSTPTPTPTPKEECATDKSAAPTPKRKSRKKRNPTLYNAETGDPNPELVLTAWDHWYEEAFGQSYIRTNNGAEAKLAQQLLRQSSGPVEALVRIHSHFDRLSKARKRVERGEPDGDDEFLARAGDTFTAAYKTSIAKGTWDESKAPAMRSAMKDRGWAPPEEADND